MKQTKNMHFKNFILGCTCLFSSFLFAQKEAAIWYFGNNAGLDFNSGSPVALTNGELNTHEGCTSISDKNGNLLFYTDGKIVFNKSHQVMPNGEGLLGHSSSTQSAIIVPKPKNPYIYYIFTVDEPNPFNTDDNLMNDEDPPNNGLNYSTVDLRLNNGMGDIVQNEKNIHLITYDPKNEQDILYKCSEKITATQHEDGVSFWVITHFKNTFYSFKIGTNGVESNPVKTVTNVTIPIGGYNSNAIGYLKASPNGKKIAMANMSTKPDNKLTPKGYIVRNTGNVFLYNFNSNTGELTNGQNIFNQSNPYGVEFSAKTKKLYVTTNQYNQTGETIGSELIQFDLLSSNIPGSAKVINSSNYVPGALQLAIDEKIYRTGYPNLVNSTSYKLSVINNPESDGTASNFIQGAVDLKTGIAKLGLPPFITSLFLYKFEYEFNCLGQATHFFTKPEEKIDGFLWNFGDGQTSTDREPYHTYATIGEYKVSLIKTVNGEQREPLERTITIYDSPTIITQPYKLVQCDTQDDNSTDGIATFGLSIADEKITLGNKDYEVFYYRSILEAENDKNNINPLKKNYRNTIPDEIIYAKVTQPDSDCYRIATVILHANKSVEILPNDVHNCDSGNGKADFNLEKIKQNIKTELNLPSDVKLFFYRSETNAALGQNEIQDTFNTGPTTIYIRAENDEGCYGAGKLNLVIETVPFNTTGTDEKVLCESDHDSFVILDSGIAPDEINNYTFLWSNNSNESTIKVNKEGEYKVDITNKTDCKITRVFTVKLFQNAQVKNIKINDLNPLNEITVELANSDDYTYAIHYQNGESTAFQTSPYFENVPGGFHELIIKNKNGCPGLVTKSFAVLNAPKFFTPNNDGHNDQWNLSGIDDPIYKNALILIYDRYGKLLKQLQPSSLGWDGFYNNMQMPSDDYWFTIKLEDGREAKGHFSLKR